MSLLPSERDVWEAVGRGSGLEFALEVLLRDWLWARGVEEATDGVVLQRLRTDLDPMVIEGFVWRIDQRKVPFAAHLHSDAGYLLRVALEPPLVVDNRSLGRVPLVDAEELILRVLTAGGGELRLTRAGLPARGLAVPTGVGDELEARLRRAGAVVGVGIDALQATRHALRLETGVHPTADAILRRALA